MDSSSLPTKKRRLRGACDLCKLKKTRCDSAKMPNSICSNCIAYNEKCTHDMASKLGKKPAYNFINYSVANESGSGNSGSLTRVTTTPDDELDIPISQILASPPRLPNDTPTLHRLVVELAERVRDLTSELAVCRQVIAREVSGSASLKDGVSPSTAATAIVDEDIATLMEDKTDLVLTDTLKRLTIGQSRHRHYGKSSGIMLMKNAMDIKKQLTGNPEGLVLNVKRAAFWNDQPWQKALHEDAYVPPYVFPEDDLITLLVDKYFAEDDILINLFYRPGFERKVAQGVYQYDRGFGAVLLAVCALGSRYMDDPRVFLDPAQEHTAGWQWFRQICPIPASFATPPTLYDLQTYTLSVLYANGTTTPESSWVLPGFGLRLAQAVGAHRRRPSEEPSIENEEWKRVFWALLCCDTISAVTTGRPTCMAVDDYDVQPSINVDDEYWEHPDPNLRFKQPAGIPSKAECWVQFSKLLEILSFAHRSIYAPRRTAVSASLTLPDWDKNVMVTVDSALNKWVDAIPDYLRWNPHNTNLLHFKQSMSMYAAYYFTQIQVHRPFISNFGTTSTVSPLSFPSLAICVNAARACCHVVDIYHQRGLEPVFLVQIMIFYSAIVLTINIWRNKAAGSHSQVNKDLGNIDKCLNILRIHERRWQIAGRYADMIRALLADLEDVPTATTEPTSQKRGRDDVPVYDSSQLSDWPYIPTPMSSSSHPPSFTPDTNLFLPVYTDELGKPSPPSHEAEPTSLNDGAYDYAAWFQEHIPVEGQDWVSGTNLYGRFSGGFLTSFMGHSDAQYEIGQDLNLNAVDQEMASWFGSMPEITPGL